MMDYESRSVECAQVARKTVLLRVDFNLPFSDGEVSDVSRIEKSLETIKYLVSMRAKIILISHFGRPGVSCGAEYSLLNVLPALEVCLQGLVSKIVFVDDCIGVKLQNMLSMMSFGDVLLAENLRFYVGEEANSADFANQLAKNADVYINDAFSCSHREHASIVAITAYLPAFLGFNFLKELRFLRNPDFMSSVPAAAVIGGAKGDTKVKLLVNLVKKLDYLILGGVLANDFLVHHKKVFLGSSLVDSNARDYVGAVMAAIESSNCELLLPIDVVVGRSTGAFFGLLKDVECVKAGEMVLDIGVRTKEIIENAMLKCKLVICNGPLGFVENKTFVSGTSSIFHSLRDLTAKSGVKSVLGGGDSLSILRRCNFKEQDFSHVSTAGGALLQFIADNTLVGLEAVMNCKLN